MIRVDAVSRRILRALDEQPRATVAWLSERLSIARGTVQARLAGLYEPEVLRPTSTLVRPEALGLSVRAIVTAEVDQARFDEAIGALRTITEVVECVAIAGQSDLQCQVFARDSADLYRIGQLILRCPGIRRTATAVVLRELIEYRVGQLLREGER